MIATAGKPKTPGKRLDSRLMFYHPTNSGGGAAMRLELRFNRPGEDRYDCFFLELAAQQKQNAPPADGGVVHASFDWQNKLTVKLGFTDICEMLMVLEGKYEKVGGGRNGLFHRNGTTSTIINMQKSEKGGICLGLSQKPDGQGEPRRIQMVLNDAESTGLRCVFQTGLFFLAFRNTCLGMVPAISPTTNET